jgi:hypothetical protein
LFFIFFPLLLAARNPCDVLPISWSEPAATNAPVEDEAVQAILGWTKNKFSQPKVFGFVSLFSGPKFFPPTYSPIPSSHLPHPSYKMRWYIKIILKWMFASWQMPWSCKGGMIKRLLITLIPKHSACGIN